MHLTTEQERNPEFFKDANGDDLEIKDRVQLGEWLAENYKNFGCSLQFVTDKSQEGSQFVKGFGGIGGILRYSVDFAVLDDQNERALGDSDDDYDWEY